MNGLRIILAGPDPNGLPAPAWLLQFLLVFTFVLHVFFMNVVLGGGIVWLWSNWKARRSPVDGQTSDDAYASLARTIGRLLPVSTAFAITSGVAPLLFLQLLYGQLFYTSSVLIAWAWFAIVVLLLVGYYANYGIFHTRAATSRALTLGLVSAVAFAVIGFIFTNNMTLMLRPEQHAPLYFESDAGLHANLADLWAWPRFAHMLVGSLAMTGLVIAWAARWQRGIDGRVADWMARAGTRLFMAATLVEFAVGVGLFFALPVPIRDVLQSGFTPDPILLASGVFFALAGVVVVRRSLLVGSCAMVVALTDMAVVRHRVRAVMLEPYFRLDSSQVAPQTGAFVLFGLLLVAGIGLVGWMIWKYVRAGSVRVSDQTVGV